VHLSKTDFYFTVLTMNIIFTSILRFLCKFLSTIQNITFYTINILNKAFPIFGSLILNTIFIIRDKHSHCNIK
jgi:hypothetical protein